MPRSTRSLSVGLPARGNARREVLRAAAILRQDGCGHLIVEPTAAGARHLHRVIACSGDLKLPRSVAATADVVPVALDAIAAARGGYLFAMRALRCRIEVPSLSFPTTHRARLQGHPPGRPVRR